MKKITVIFLLMSLAISSYGQKLTKGMVIKGNDSLHVDLKLPVIALTDKLSYVRIQKKIKYFNNNGEKVVLKAGEADEVQLYLRGDTIRMLTRVAPLQVPCERCKASYVFLKLVRDGKVKLFKYSLEDQLNYNLADIDVLQRTKYYYYYQKGIDKIYSPNNFLFKKEMSKYFSDCDILVKKIKAKELRKKDEIEIVEFYNSNCGK
jgi:hypothetical protein